ncbi:hypothetical protein [Rhizohabitans arisaemae]|uniref:hypothetical protein n=1 Tax=Rhizohabitans arisaemae TaxID=2720610 RepID=UPI0024B16CCE|nr:hypothetical protein [Rhizohabitans arisaemae]
MTAWETVRKLIERKDADGIAAFAAGLDKAERREVADNLPGHLAVLRTPNDPWRTVALYGLALRAAGAATIEGAAALATWLHRRDHSPRRTEDTAERTRLLTILQARPVEWQADLAGRLALKIRNSRSWGLGIVLELLRRTGAEPPAHDALVVGWVATTTPSEEAARPGSLLERMLPRIFEAEGVGRALESTQPDDPWIAELIADAGPARRETLLSGCVGRFLRGGSPTGLRYYGRLHEALKPTAEEIAPRARDYVRLLPAAPGPIAELALRHLRTLDDLDPFELAEALEGVLFRPERRPAESGLAWLEESVRRKPGLADDLAGALAVAFGHKTFEVRRRAVRLALNLAPGLSAESTAVIGGAVSGLPPELGAALAGVFGGEVAEAEEVFDDFVPGTPPDPIRPGPFPAPIESPEEIDTLFKSYEAYTWRNLERILAALVTLDLDRDMLTGDLRAGYVSIRRRWSNSMSWLNALHRTLHVRVGEHTLQSPPSFPAKLPDPSSVSPPVWLTLNRCAELFDALVTGNAPPVLLATPTRDDGRLDPGVFVDRLAACEAAGLPPLPADFQQALLRVARTVPADVLRRAAALTSPEGRQAGRWLADGGLPDPKVTLEWSAVHHTRSVRSLLPAATEPEGGDPAHAGSGPSPGDGGLRLFPMIDCPATGYALIDRILTDPRRCTCGMTNQRIEDFSSTLPGHRELNAAHLLVFLGDERYRRAYATREHLFTLVRSGGASGEVFSAVLARVILPDGFWQPMLQMLAEDGFPAGELAFQLAQRVKHGGESIKKLSDALEQFARKGAHHQVWPVTETVLRLLLPAEGEKAGTGLVHLITFAATLARWTDNRTEIPELAAFAARKGDTKVLREARAAHACLTRP